MRRRPNKILYILFIFFLNIAVYAQENIEFEKIKTEPLSYENAVQLYPSPSIDFLEVKINTRILGDPEFTVYDIIGVPMDVSVQQYGKGYYKFNINGLTSGYYLLSVRDKVNSVNRIYKFVKK